MTAVQSALDSADSTPADAAPRDAAKRAATYDKLALQQLLAPTRSATSRASRYQWLASAATVVPFVGIVELGRALLGPAPVDTTRVWIIVAVVAVALLVRTVAGGAALTITHHADVDLQRTLRRRLVDKLGTLPLGWFNNTTSGEVNKVVQNDVGELHFLVAHSAVENTGAIATPLFGLVYCFYLDWRLGLLAMATIPVYIAVYLTLGRDTRTQMERLDRGIERISATIVEFIAGVSVVKIFGEAGKAHKRFADAADEFNDSFAEWIGPLVRVKAASSIFIDTPVLFLANLAGGYWFVRNGWVTPIEVLGAMLVAVTIPAAILTVGYSTHIKRQAAAAAGRLQRLLDTPSLPTPTDPQVPQNNSVEFDNVSFSYDGTTTVLDGVTLSLPPGTITALVGPSGSGKSTLATLVPRFYDVDAGAVRVGGVDVREIATSQLYRHVGFVLQDVHLLGISVADNIRLGKADASPQDVEAAARAACIHERILQLPRGYDSIVGDDAHFSGGEAQRVSIARALLADTTILVLDEATAFADPDSEAQIQDALSRLIVGRTVLVIAHRLGSVVSADNIVVLDRGRISEQGRHQDLLDAGQQYARMWQSYNAGHATEWEVAR